jgi:hypothetical protein
MCQPVSRQSRFSLIFFVQQEPEPEPEPRARIRFRFFLGQNDTVPAVPEHWLGMVTKTHFYVATDEAKSGDGCVQVHTAAVVNS